MSLGRELSTWILIAGVGLGGVASAATFDGWVRTYGHTHNMHLDRRWQKPLAAGGQPFLVARLCEGEGKNGYVAEHAAYLLDDQQGRRWAITLEQNNRVYCDSDKYSPFGHLRRPEAMAKDLLLCDFSYSHQELQYWIGVRGGEPVIVGETEWLADHPTLKGPFYEDDTSQDWDELVLRERRGHVDFPRRVVFDRRAAIIPVLREPAVRSPLTQLIRGPWDGEKDAGLRVSAEPVQDGRVHLHIDLSDDLQVLASEDATDAELTRADHLQLWHCFSNEMKHARCSELHSLRLAFTRGGRWIVRGSDADPQLRPLEVTGTATAADIILDVGVGKDGGHKGWRRGFTVVYSDVDGPGKPALLGTSRLNPKDPETLGLLVALPDYRRYPAIGSSNPIEMSVKAL